MTGLLICFFVVTTTSSRPNLEIEIFPQEEEPFEIYSPRSPSYSAYLDGLAEKNEAAVLEQSSTIPSNMIKSILTYLEIVEAKIIVNQYDCNKHSRKIGTDIDNLVVPRLEWLTLRFPYFDALSDILKRFQDFALVPLCHPFVKLVDDAFPILIHALKNVAALQDFSDCDTSDCEQ
jgi:hypothetical protein